MAYPDNILLSCVSSLPATMVPSASIDGGYTTQLLAQIQQSWSQGAWELRNDLMAQSPYVSEEVLRQVAEDNLLPQAMLLEVCLANPDATRSEGFLDYLEYQVANPLPGYMIDMIVASWGTITARTLLEDGLAYFEREKAVASNLLLSHYRADSVDQTDSIRYWLRRRGDLPDHYALAETFLATNEFDSAHAVLLAIPTQFQLDQVEQGIEQSDYLAYYQFQRAMYEDGRSIMELDSIEIRTLENLAYGSDSRASILADNILCFGYGICKDLSEKDSEGSNARYAGPAMDPQRFIQSQYYQLRVFPNPANDYATFEWDLVNLESMAHLRILDATGRVVASHVVESTEGQWLWDTRAVPRGLYLYELRDSDDTLMTQGKISLE